MEVVEMVSGETVVIVKVLVTSWAGVKLSVRVTENDREPNAVEIPLITPALESVMPGGRIPVDDQVYGGTPPVATKVVLYATFSEASGSVSWVVIDSAGLTMDVNV